MGPFICGIDPGIRGGVAILDSTGGVIDLRVMPSDVRELSELLSEAKRGCAASGNGFHVFLEKAQTMGKENARSAFSYGRHFGELLGMLMILGISHTLVPPAVWSREMHAGTKDSGDTKARSAEAAMRLAPTVSFRLAKSISPKPHDGLTEAYLIAEYGRRKLVRG